VLGIDVAGGDVPEPVLRALRDLLEQEQGAEGKRARQREAAARLEAAGLWDDALALLARVGTREELLETLGAALHASPPLAPGVADRWIADIEDHEAATHHALALQRARWHERRGDPAAALAVLRRVEAPVAGDEDGSWPQLAQEVERLSARPATLATVLAALAFAAAAGVAGHAWQAPQWAFIFLLGAAIALWVTALLPDFLVCAGLVVGWVLCGVATPAQALAGFGTPSWTTAFAILSLAAAISSSGLLFRFGLLLVRRMPDGLFAQAATFLFTGILLTPLLPSSTARSGLAVPLALTAAQAQRLKERGPESAMLGMAAYIGANPMLFMFLNGSTSCLLALGLASEATRARFDFVHWLVAAFPLALFTALGSLLMMWLLLRPGRVERASRAQLNLQLSLLGKPSARELAMTAILLLAVAGWNVGPALGLHPSTIGLVSVLAAAVAGCFTRASLQGLNWDFLIAYGPILTISQLVTSLGVDTMAAEVVRQVVGEGGVPPLAFVLLVAALSLVVRIFLPQDQALLLLALALLPAAPVVGVDPWVILITLLATFSMWYFPSQTVGYLVAYDASEERLFTHRQARLVSYGFSAVVLLSLALCVPYWALLGLV
jgi:di/tricarboxylate transporter